MKTIILLGLAAVFFALQACSGGGMETKPAEYGALGPCPEFNNLVASRKTPCRLIDRKWYKVR